MVWKYHLKVWKYQPSKVILKSLEDRNPRIVVVKSKLQLGFETLTYFYHVISMEVASPNWQNRSPITITIHSKKKRKKRLPITS
jgi:hypothetical protein